MRYERELTPPELKILGPTPNHRLNKIIDDALRCMWKLNEPKSVESRITTLLSETESMTALNIRNAHNALFGGNPISIAYTRFVLSGMFSAGIVARAKRGRYIKKGES